MVHIWWVYEVSTFAATAAIYITHFSLICFRFISRLYCVIIAHLYIAYTFRAVYRSPIPAMNRQL